MKGYRKICGKPWEASNENSLYHDQSTPVTDYKPATIVVEGTISWRGSICFSLLMDIIYALSLSYLKELKNTFVFQKLFWDMMDRKPSDYQILSLLFWFVFWSGYKTDSVTEKGNKTWGHFSVKLFWFICKKSGLDTWQNKDDVQGKHILAQRGNWECAKCVYGYKKHTWPTWCIWQIGSKSLLAVPPMLLSPRLFSQVGFNPVMEM